MKGIRTCLVCITVLWLGTVFLLCVDSLLRYDRELVIRHVIDLTPNLKRK